MKKRNLLLVFVLTILTLGIYMLAWLYLTRKEAVKTLGDPKAIPPVIILFSPLLLLIVLILTSMVFRGNDSSLFSILGSLLGIVAILGMFVIPLWWIYKYSYGIHRVTHKTEPMMLFILFILLSAVSLGFVWMILVQNDINESLEHQAAAPQPVGPVPVAGQYPQQSWQHPQPPAAPPPPAPPQAQLPHVPQHIPGPEPIQQPHAPAQPEEDVQNLPPPTHPT